MFFDPCPTKISLKIYKMYGSSIQVGLIFYIQTVHLLFDKHPFLWHDFQTRICYMSLERIDSNGLNKRSQVALLITSRF